MVKPGFCSVIIVFKDAEKFVKPCLDSIFAQGLHKDDYEVLIVDSMSKDKSIETAEVLLKANNVSYKIFKNPKLLLAAGWNIGLSQAKGDYVIRPDAHCILDKAYITAGIACLKKDPDLAGVGGVLQTRSDGFWGRMIAIVLSNPIGVGGARFRTGVKEAVYTDTIVYGVYRKQAFDEAGLLNESMARNQDIDLHKRMIEKGYKLLTSPVLKAVYFSRSNLSGFLKQGFWNGYWVTYAWAGYFRHFAPLFFVVLIAALGVISWRLLVVFLIFYMSVLLSFYVKLSLVMNPAILLGVGLLTFGLHLVYGLGSIAGLLSSFVKSFLKRKA
ncbi:glycosyltransferase [Thermoproteota archaeon]